MFYITSKRVFQLNNFIENINNEQVLAERAIAVLRSFINFHLTTGCILVEFFFEFFKTSNTFFNYFLLYIDNLPKALLINNPINFFSSVKFMMELGTDLFLSHDWGKDESGRDNHYRVSLINTALKELGYQTWFDEERMEGNIEEKMSQGIEQTKVVFTFITRRYHDKVNSTNFNDNCKLEFNYASIKKTSSKMIAVVMEKGMLDAKRWTGTVGMRLGGNIYVDMSGDLDDKTYLSQQLKLLQKHLCAKGIQPLSGTHWFYFTFHYHFNKSSEIKIV